MKKIFQYSLLGVGLALVASTQAHAGRNFWWNAPKPTGPTRNSPTAPEVDPNMAVGGFTLLAGALTVMRARRRK